MTNIDPAIVEAVLRDVPFANRDGHGCAHRIYGPCSACEAATLAPLIADAVKNAWDEGYATCLGDFDIAARRESRSPNPHREVTL